MRKELMLLLLVACALFGLIYNFFPHYCVTRGSLRATSKTFMITLNDVEPSAEKTDTNLTIVYDSTLRNCKLPTFDATKPILCWNSTKTNNAGRKICGPSVMLLGFHKSGTSDMSKWMVAQKNVATTKLNMTKQALNDDTCPLDVLESQQQLKKPLPSDEHRPHYIYFPGCLVATSGKSSSDILVLKIATQYLAEFMTEDTRFIITMRHPTDRVISHYYFFFQQGGSKQPLFKNHTPEEMGAKVFHDLIVKEIDVINLCIKEHGEFRCVHELLGGGKYKNEIVINSLIKQSLYSVYIRAALEFIPREKIYFSQMERYAADTERVVNEIMEFIGSQPISKSAYAELVMRRTNTGKIAKRVLPETIHIMDSFFKPFLEDLAQLLQDDRWLFSREKLPNHKH